MKRKTVIIYHDVPLILISSQNNCEQNSECQFFVYRKDYGFCDVYLDDFSGISECHGLSGPNEPAIEDCEEGF